MSVFERNVCRVSILHPFGHRQKPKPIGPFTALLSESLQIRQLQVLPVYRSPRHLSKLPQPQGIPLFRKILKIHTTTNRHRAPMIYQNLPRERLAPIHSHDRRQEHEGGHEGLPLEGV